MGPIIEFTKEEKNILEKRWANVLIIKILGGSIGFMYLRKRFQLLWGKNGKVELFDIGNG